MTDLYRNDWVRSDHRGGIFISAAHVSADEMPGVVDLMYRVSGRPAPIIVENPDVYELGACNLPGGRRIDWDDETGLINLRGSHAVHQYSPDEAIEAGSWLIALGKAAKTGPSRAEVERLAAFLDESMDATPEGLARAFLARFEVKERAQ